MQSDILRGTVPGTKRSGAPHHQRFLASGAPYPVQNHQGHFGSCSSTQIRAMAVRHRTLGEVAGYSKVSQTTVAYCCPNEIFSLQMGGGKESVGGTFEVIFSNKLACSSHCDLDSNKKKEMPTPFLRCFLLL